jgi:hypothetical protein
MFIQLEIADCAGVGAALGAKDPACAMPHAAINSTAIGLVHPCKLGSQFCSACDP